MKVIYMAYADKEKQKECARTHYLANKETYKLRAKAYKKKNVAYLTEFINRYKHIKGCSKCGERRPYVLEFHHVKDKICNIADLVMKSVGIKTLKREIRKCILLCANCHREVHFFKKLRDKAKIKQDECKSI